LKEESRGIIKVASTYMATIIGAGFASGQEIVQFFSSYRYGGFLGILLSGILFALIGYVVLDKVYSDRIKNYDELIFPAVGWGLGWIIEAVVSIFMLSVFCIMIAGAGNVFMDRLSIPFNYGIILMAIICMVAIFTDIKGIIAISTAITPILIVGILTIGIFTIVSNNTVVFSFGSYFTKATRNWLFSSLIYVGYNSIIAIVVMCGLLPQLKVRRIGRMGGILGGGMLCIIALILNAAIFIYHPEVLYKELPVLSITEGFGSILNNFYAFILILAMFISAVTAGYGFVDRVRSKININKKLLIIALCGISIPLSNFGFSKLISTLYPIFGYIGLFIILVVLIQSIKFKPGNY